MAAVVAVRGVPLVDVSMRLGLPYQSTWNLLCRGILQGARDGREWRIDPASIETAKAYLASEAPA